MSDRAEFETYWMDHGYDSFNGGVSGSLADVIAFVDKLHRALYEGGIDCHFEVYDDEQGLVREFGN